MGPMTLHNVRENGVITYTVVARFAATSLSLISVPTQMN